MDDIKAIIAKSLMIPEDRIVDGLEYNSIPEWDSIAHMALVADIEDNYSVMLDTDDIVAMSSVVKIREILGKYDVQA